MTYQKGEDRLRETLKFLIKFLEEKRYSPSYADICKGAGVKSKSHVSKILQELEDRFYIERENNKARSIRILEEAYTFLDETANRVVRRLEDILVLPISGRIVASEPIPMPDTSLGYYDPESTVELMIKSLPPGEKIEDLFALEVDGDSMVDAMINDGDIVIMRRADRARNGEMVAVWLDDNNETTLKYFYRETVKENGKSRERVRLQPANPTMQPIYIDNPSQVRIKGKVVMVIRHQYSLVN